MLQVLCCLEQLSGYSSKVSFKINLPLAVSARIAQPTLTEKHAEALGPVLCFYNNYSKLNLPMFTVATDCKLSGITADVCTVSSRRCS